MSIFDVQRFVSRSTFTDTFFLSRTSVVILRTILFLVVDRNIFRSAFSIIRNVKIILFDLICRSNELQTLRWQMLSKSILQDTPRKGTWSGQFSWPSPLFYFWFLTSFSNYSDRRPLTSSNVIVSTQRKRLDQLRHLTKRSTKQRCVFRSPAKEKPLFSCRETSLCCVVE